jgi:hypothetical protein
VKLLIVGMSYKVTEGMKRVDFACVHEVNGLLTKFNVF